MSLDAQLLTCAQGVASVRDTAGLQEQANMAPLMGTAAD